jgi:glycosyltransferase involved in cell wall biosynthesis
MNKKIIIAIDASRNRSGGSKSHIIGILNDSINPSFFGIHEIHIWSYKKLLDQLPGKPWLIKHYSPWLELNIFFQIFWQFFIYSFELKKAKVNILLNTDAGTFCHFKPAVTMSRDMLSYEKKELRRYIYSLFFMRLFALRYIQNFNFITSNGVIFLTNYAAQAIQKYTGKLKNFTIISHGVSNSFRLLKRKKWPNRNINARINCVYVSNIDLYKHQSNVAQAISFLRHKGINIGVTFVGAPGRGSFDLNNVIKNFDPNSNFIHVLNETPHTKIPKIISRSDIFIFASTCENMPNSLIEAMASGIPIACSSNGPMPEILQNGGFYFNPENLESIANAVLKLINSRKLRDKCSKNAKTLSDQFSWRLCSNKTWQYLVKIHENFVTNGQS